MTATLQCVFSPLDVAKSYILDPRLTSPFALFNGPSVLEMSPVFISPRADVGRQSSSKTSTEKMFRAAATLAEETGDSC